MDGSLYKKKRILRLLNKMTVHFTISRRYMDEILPIWRKTLSNQSIDR